MNYSECLGFVAMQHRLTAPWVLGADLMERGISSLVLQSGNMRQGPGSDRCYFTAQWFGTSKWYTGNKCNGFWPPHPPPPQLSMNPLWRKPQACLLNQLLKTILLPSPPKVLPFLAIRHHTVYWEPVTIRNPTVHIVLHIVLQKGEWLLCNLQWFYRRANDY